MANRNRKKRENKDLQITTQKTTDWATRTPQKTGMNSGVSATLIQY